MIVLVCVKVVYDEERLVISKDEIAKIEAPLKISNLDLSAIACASMIREKQGDVRVIGVYVGNQIDSKLSKDLLSRGLDELVCLKCNSKDSISSVQVLAKYAEQIKPDIILCGKASSDLFQGVFAPYLAGLIDAHYVDGVEDILEVGEKMLLKTSFADKVLNLEVSFPCALSIDPEGFEPKIPGMKAILEAAKKPFDTQEVQDVNTPLNLLSMKPPKVRDRDKQIFAFADLERFKENFLKLV